MNQSSEKIKGIINKTVLTLWIMGATNFAIANELKSQDKTKPQIEIAKEKSDTQIVSKFTKNFDIQIPKKRIASTAKLIQRLSDEDALKLQKSIEKDLKKITVDEDKIDYVLFVLDRQ